MFYWAIVCYRCLRTFRPATAVVSVIVKESRAATPTVTVITYELLRGIGLHLINLPECYKKATNTWNANQWCHTIHNKYFSRAMVSDKKKSEMTMFTNEGFESAANLLVFDKTILGQKRLSNIQLWLLSMWIIALFADLANWQEGSKGFQFACACICPYCSACALMLQNEQQKMTPLASTKSANITHASKWEK